MAKRHGMTRGSSRRSFRRSAGTHRKNVQGNVMRGGIRL